MSTATTPDATTPTVLLPVESSARIPSVSRLTATRPPSPTTSSPASAIAACSSPWSSPPTADGWQVISGHRRLACARRLGLPRSPARSARSPAPRRRRAVLEYNRQRPRPSASSCARPTPSKPSSPPPPTAAAGPTSARRTRPSPIVGIPTIEPAAPTPPSPAPSASAARTSTARPAPSGAARDGDPRALAAVAQLDAGTKTIHAAYKDLRRRDRFTAGFRPTPYDVWPFRHDRAYGLPHPGSIPAAIVAHTLHYFTAPGDLVVDPMAGGGTTLDVCQAMGRRCLAYDIHPVRPEIDTRTM